MEELVFQKPEVKKRGPKPGSKREGKKVGGLPTEGSLVTKALFEAFKKLLRVGDGKKIAEHLKEDFSDPVVRNFLNNGYCSDAKLWNKAAAWLMNRSNEENAMAQKMLESEVFNVDALLQLVDSKRIELAKHFKELQKARIEA